MTPLPRRNVARFSNLRAFVKRSVSEQPLQTNQTGIVSHDIPGQQQHLLWPFRLPAELRYHENSQPKSRTPLRRKEFLMNRAFLAALLSAFLLLTGGCKSNADNKDAIRDGVVKHIAGMNGLNVNNMTVTVTKATFNGDKAQADVDIRAKNGDPGAPAMQLSYELQKQGDEWVVLKGQARGGMQHPTAGEMPPSGTLPPRHPSTAGQMPANHPDFNSILNSVQPPPQTQQPHSNGQQSSGNSKP